MSATPAMTPVEPATPDAPASGSSGHATLIACAFALLMGVLVAGLCRFAAGPTLGLFLGTTLLACLVAPALLTPFQWPSFLCLWLGIALVWLLAATHPSIYLMDVLRSLIVIGAMMLALAGQAQFFRWLRLPDLLAAALVTLLALASITWPLWAVDALEGPHAETIVGLLVPISPAFAINGTMPHLGAWDHYPHLAYTTLTVLNQDVAYHLPHSILPAALLHGAMGLLLLLGRKAGASPSTPSRP